MKAIPRATAPMTAKLCLTKSINEASHPLVKSCPLHLLSAWQDLTPPVMQVSLEEELFGYSSVPFRPQHSNFCWAQSSISLAPGWSPLKYSLTAWSNDFPTAASTCYQRSSWMLNFWTIFPLISNLWISDVYNI